MNYKLHNTTIDILNLIQRFLIAYSILALILMPFASYSAPAILCLLPASLISYFIRRRTKQLWLFLALHTCILVVYYFAASLLLLKIAYLTYLIIMICYSFYQKAKPERQENTSAVFYVAFLLIQIISYYLELTDLLQLNLYLAVSFTVLNFITMYLLNFKQYFANQSRMENIPYHQIINSNHTIILFLSSLFAITMLLFAQLPIDASFSALWKLLVRLLKSIFSFQQSSEDINETVDSAAAVPQIVLPSAKETPYLLQLLLNIMEWILKIGAIIAAIALVLYLLYQLYQYFYSKKDHGVTDKIEFISPFVKKESLKKSVKRSFLSIFSRTNNDMIRKHFYKAVISSMSSKTKISKTLTPTQLSEYALTGIQPENSAANMEKKKLLTSYYEKARYSNQQCSKEEVETVKRIIK